MSEFVFKLVADAYMKGFKNGCALGLMLGVLITCLGFYVAKYFK